MYETDQYTCAVCVKCTQTHTRSAVGIQYTHASAVFRLDTHARTAHFWGKHMCGLCNCTLYINNGIKNANGIGQISPPAERKKCASAGLPAACTSLSPSPKPAAAHLSLCAKRLETYSSQRLSRSLSLGGQTLTNGAMPFGQIQGNIPPILRLHGHVHRLHSGGLLERCSLQAAKLRQACFKKHFIP